MAPKTLIFSFTAGDFISGVVPFKNQALIIEVVR
jgi:hypothetical protein